MNTQKSLGVRKRTELNKLGSKWKDENEDDGKDVSTARWATAG